MSEVKSLVQGLREETERCRELLKMYEAIPEGVFAAGFLREDLISAESAMDLGDPIEMLKSLKKLEEIE